jgi:ubiquinol-cytochrome c reductase cytochrome b subunit
VFYWPTVGGLFLEHDNFVPANPLVTPEHIKPVWYFMPYYAMLRAVPSFFGTQVWGVLVMGGAVLILFLLPWLDKCEAKSIRYRPLLHKVLLTIFVVAFVVLGLTVMLPGNYTLLSQVLTIYYFLFFLTMPVWSRMGQIKAVPERVTMHD